MEIWPAGPRRLSRRFCQCWTKNLIGCLFPDETSAESFGFRNQQLPFFCFSSFLFALQWSTRCCDDYLHMDSRCPCFKTAICGPLYQFETKANGLPGCPGRWSLAGSKRAFNSVRTVGRSGEVLESPPQRHGEHLCLFLRFVLLHLLEQQLRVCLRCLDRI